MQLFKIQEHMETQASSPVGLRTTQEQSYGLQPCYHAAPPSQEEAYSCLTVRDAEGKLRIPGMASHQDLSPSLRRQNMSKPVPDSAEACLACKQVEKAMKLSGNSRCPKS